MCRVDRLHEAALHVKFGIMALLSVVSHVAFTQVWSCAAQCTHEAKAIIGGDCYRKGPACVRMHCLGVAYCLEHCFDLLQLNLFALH